MNNVMALSPNRTQNGGEQAVSRGPVPLGEKFWVFPDAALPDFDSPTARAYRAEDRSNPGRKLFALVCRPETVPRTEDMARIKGSDIPNLLPLIEWGTLLWPSAARNCIAVIFERPQGGRVSEVITKSGAHIRPHDMARDIIQPLMRVGTGLADFGVPHRNIRPDNLFYMDAERTRLVVGECVTVPPGFDQPVVFETIERGLAMPAGRGRGGPAEDFYAIGVTLIFLLKGSASIDQLDNREILLSKMSHGSYATLVGKERIPLNLLEPLRGLLSDDPAQRWGFDEMQLWLDGRRMTPMQRKAVAKAERPLTFQGKDYLDIRKLAMAMHEKPAEAVKMIREGDLEIWVRRGFENDELANLIMGAVHSSTAMSAGSVNPDDILLARVLILLDPEAPLRYRGFSCMPDGIGPALAYLYMTKGDAQIPTEMIIREIPEMWFNAQHSAITGMPGGDKVYTQLRRYLQIPEPGYGIERCLYETNPEMHCLSPFVETRHVTIIEDLLPALEEAAKRVDPKTKPVDRHIAAFISVRFSQNIETHLNALASKDQETSTLGMLSLLAVLQWRLAPNSTLLALSSWLGGLMGPALTIYHSHTTRRQIEREIPKLVRKGSLPEIFNLLDNAQKREEDMKAFHEAQAEYAETEAEIDRLKTAGADSEENIRVGNQTAAVVSIVLMIIVITLLFILNKW